MAAARTHSKEPAHVAETAPTDVDGLMKPCTQCAALIPETAHLCRHCSTYQDWRGALHVSQTTLALLVALITVITAAVPPIANLIWGNRSNLSAAFWQIESSEVVITVSNSGDRPGFVDGATFYVWQSNGNGTEGTAGVGLRIQGEGKIEPGTQERVSFDIDPNWQTRIAAPLYEHRSSDECFIRFRLRQFDASETVLEHPIDCYDGLMGLAPLAREQIRTLKFGANAN